jgi:hypothetical protein
MNDDQARRFRNGSPAARVSLHGGAHRNEELAVGHIHVTSAWESVEKPGPHLPLLASPKSRARRARRAGADPVKCEVTERLQRTPSFLIGLRKMGGFFMLFMYGGLAFLKEPFRETSSSSRPPLKLAC